MRRATATGIAVSLAAASVAALTLDARDRASVSSPAAIVTAARSVAKELRPGDVVVASPAWEQLAWLPLSGARIDGIDAAPWPALWRSPRADPIALLSFDRLWMIGVDGRPAVPPTPIAEGCELQRRSQRGAGVEVALYRLASLERVRTLTKDFATLSVRRVHADGHVDRCRYRGQRHRCQREHWLDLQLVDRDVFHREVHWALFHPGPSGETLEVDWPGLPRQGWLMVRAGFSLQAVRSKDGAPVTLTTRVDGVEVDRVTLAPHRYALERRLIQMPAGAGEATVTLAVETDDNGWRELLVQADIIVDPPALLRRWATAVIERPTQRVF